jgi:Holliday junction resolvase RusA-like endonuclease
VRPETLDTAATMAAMSITFSVDGEPVPQPRARITTRGKFAHAYVEDKHPVHAYRKAIQLAAVDAGLRPCTGLVVVEIDAVFTRPKSHLNKKGLKPTAPLAPRPDVDNVAKAILDSIGPVLGNDSQVKRLVIEKRYGTEARTTVRVT